MRTEGEKWAIIQLAGQADLLVFDVAKGFKEPVTRISLPASIVDESAKFKAFDHASQNYHKQWCWTSTSYDQTLLIAVPNEKTVGELNVHQVKGTEVQTKAYSVTNGYPVDFLMLSYYKGRVALVVSYYTGMYLRLFNLGQEAQLINEYKRSTSAA